MNNFFKKRNIKTSESRKELGLILQIDFEKAFDSVEWNFLIQTLIQFGFGNDFVSY